MSRRIAAGISALVKQHAIDLWPDPQHPNRTLWCKLRLIINLFCKDQELRRFFYSFFKSIRVLFPCSDRHSYTRLEDVPVVLFFLLHHPDNRVPASCSRHQSWLDELLRHPPVLACTYHRPNVTTDEITAARQPLRHAVRLYHRTVAMHRAGGASRKEEERRPLPAHGRAKQLSRGTGSVEWKKQQRRLAVRPAPAGTLQRQLFFSAAAAAAAASRKEAGPIASLPETLSRHLCTLRRCRACGELAAPRPRVDEDDDLKFYAPFLCVACENPQYVPGRSSEMDDEAVSGDSEASV
jgi:hypothetical protein